MYCDLWAMEEAAFNHVRALAASMAFAVESLPPPVAVEAVRHGPGSGRQPRTVAVIPVHGTLEARSSMFGQMLGMSSMETIGRVFDQVIGDESVSAVVLDVASPGGMFYGAPELAAKIFHARGTKPIISVANPLAASGGFWIAAAADRLVMTPSADTGSLGVLASRLDVSEAMKAQGVKDHIFRSAVSPFKAEHLDSEGLTQEAKDAIQERIDAMGEMFVADIAKFRGKATDYVKANFGRGRVVGAKQAVAVGMADRIDTLDGIITKLAANRIRIARGEAVQDEWNALSEEEMFRQRAKAKRQSVLAAAEST